MSKPAKWGLWLGILVGLLVAVTELLVQYGMELGNSGQTWFFIPEMLTGFLVVWCSFAYEARCVYWVVLLGVLLNGLFHAGVWHMVAIRLRSRWGVGLRS